MAGAGGVSSALRIRLFGPFDARVDGCPLPRLHSRKGQWLLALLALRAGREVERAWLAGTLWPESEERIALHNLRQTLNGLRRALGPAAGRLHSPTAHSLCLALSDTDCDTLAFDTAIAEGKRQKEKGKNEAEEAPSLHPSSFILHPLQVAVSLYRGPLLEGCNEEWVLPERAAREQAYLSALETLGEQAKQRGDPREAVRWLRLAVAADPLRESAHRPLMQSLSEMGDFASAQQVYRDLRLWLHRELNAEPAPETTALFQQIREAARRPVSPRPETPRPLRSLPSPLTHLIGRKEELRELNACLSSARLLTLTGVGGVGKTRLAIAAAHAAAENFPDGVVFVDLTALSDPALVPQAIAAPLDVREEPGKALLETLTTRLQDRHLLLLLDNCEHLITACAQVADTLLSHCPRLHILATSRQSLGLPGEAVWRAPSLSVPPALEIEKDRFSRLMEYDAVRLFVERASERDARIPFPWTPRNAEAVAQTCRRLDGVPLAIELAAARVKGLSVEQVAARLGESLSLLTGGSRAARPRQKTLRAAIDWSHSLLTEAEQMLLRRLAVFAGGWTLEAAEAVCDGSMEYSVLGIECGGSIPNTEYSILDLLSSLVDKSLIVVEEDREGAVRYRLLETIRQYAAERLRASDEWERVHRRHLDFFLTLAEQANSKLTGPEQTDWLDRLEREHDNLRAALRCAVDGSSLMVDGNDGDPSTGLRLTGALAHFWRRHGHLREGLGWLARALADTRAAARTKERAQALIGSGNLAMGQGDYAAARSFLEESLEILRESGDRLGIAGALASLGSAAQLQDDPVAARPLFEESLALFRELNNVSGIATMLNNLANITHRQADYAGACALFEEALSIHRKLGNSDGIATSLNNLGNVACDRGGYAQARSLYEESLAIRRELQDEIEVARTLTNLADLAFREGNYKTAQEIDEESLAIRRALGDRRGIAWSLSNLASVACAQGDHAAARALSEESLAMFREMGNQRGVALSLDELGRVARAEGGHAAARAFYAESLTIKQQSAEKREIAASLGAFADLAGAQKQFARAARLYAAAAALREVIGAPLPPSGRKDYDCTIAAAHEALDAAAFAAAWAEGHAMTLEQAVEHALEET